MSQESTQYFILPYRSFIKAGYLLHPQHMIFVTQHNRIRLEVLVHIRPRVLFLDSQRTFTILVCIQLDILECNLYIPFQ